MHHRARFHQKMVANLQKPCNLTVFKMAAVRHLGFLKFNFLTARAARRHILHHRTKYSKDPLNRCGDMDMATFVIFKTFEILTIGPLKGVNMRHRARFHQNRANGCRDVAI